MLGLVITLLGTPQVLVDGAPLRVDTRKALAMLAYLATAGSPQTRDRVATLLWPDSPVERASGSLRRTLSVLTSGLGGRWVEADRTFVTLDSEDTTFDVAELRAGLARVAAHAHDALSSCASCRTDLAEATDRYQGGFMEGFHLRGASTFDDWQLLEGEALRRETSDALGKLAIAEAANGDLEAALSHARRWLELDPLAEHAHRTVMHVAARLGRRDEALQQYRTCTTLLDRELGVPPLPETTSLHDAIVAGTVVADPAALAKPPPAATTTAATPLVGRDDELTWLRHKHAEASGGTVVVALEGEAGIGKTRLLDELVAAVIGAGAQPLRARCHEGEQTLAFGPVVELLRPVADVPGRALSATTRRELARLLPELAPGEPPTGPLDSPGARARLFAAVADGIESATSGGKAGIVAIDDLHWADATTLEFLSWLAHRPGGRPIFVVVTWRTEAVPADHPVRRVVETAPRRLGRLDRDAVGEVVAAVRPDLTGLVNRLHAETDGIPFFLVQYLAALPPEADVPWDLPGPVRDLVRTRLRPVSPLGRQFLSAAAVIGRSTDLATVLHASGRSEEEGVSAIEELLRHDLLREQQSGGAPHYDFTHPSIREVVLEDASLARRRLVHRRTADALMAAATDAPARAAVAVRAAGHYEAAGMDLAAAEQYVLAAGHARSLYANAEALGHLEAALALGHRDPAPLHRQVGELHTLAGRYTTALESFAVARAYVEAPLEVARLEWRIGEVQLRLGDWALARAHLEAASEHLAIEESPAQAARISADLSLALARLGDTRAANDEAVHARSHADQSGDTTAQAQVCNLLGMLARAEGDPRRAQRQFKEALALTDGLADPSARIAALNNLALVEAETGQIDHAIELLEDAAVQVETIGDRHRAAAIHNNLADALHAAGRDDEAIEHLKIAAGLFADVGEAGQLRPEIWQLVDW